jgi:hypothetical protein
LDFVVCPEEPALYFNEGVALRNLPSISTRGLLPDPAGFYLTVSPFCFVECPTCLCLRQAVVFISFCLVVLSCRLVISPFCLIAFCLVLSRRFSVSFGFGCAFVRPLFCLVVLLHHFVSSLYLVILPSSGRFLCLVLSRRFVSLLWIRFCLRQAVILPPSGRRFVSSICHVLSCSISFVLPSSGRYFAFVRPPFCLVTLSCRFVLSFCLVSFCLVVLSRRFSVSLFGFSVAFVRPSFCPHWAVGSRYFRSRYCFVTWIASSSLSSLSSHPPTPHDYNPPERGRGGGGLSARGRAWGGEEDREWSECSRRRCWICKGGPRLEFR